MVQFGSLVYGAFTRRFRRRGGGTVGRNWAGRNLDVIQGMENRRYRNGSHQVRVNAPRPFRHARRIQKLANSATAHSSLLPDHYFIWDPTEPVATRPLAWKRGTSVAYYTHDGNKNVSEVIASNNDVAAHYEYAPFGALTVSRGASAADNPWRFSSEYVDDALGCVYYNYRHLNSGLGQWLCYDLYAKPKTGSLYIFFKFCSECILELRSCRLGLNSLLKVNLEKKTGCRVLLHDYPVYYDGSEEWPWWKLGGVL